MRALDEAKEFVRLHARHMGLSAAEIERVLDRIHDLDGVGEGGWVTEWSRLAAECHESGNTPDAANLYVLARFPCADTPAKASAARSAASATVGWMAETGAGEKRFARVGEAKVSFLFSRPPKTDAPLVVMMGGIVALKEQWSGFLGLSRRLGCAIAIADFPGVGENEVPYSRAAADVYTAIMDAVADDCDAANTLAVAPSFGGHLAMLCSARDERLRRLVTVGAPLRAFFTDPDAHAGMPRITRAALGRAARVSHDELAARLDELALAPDEIAALRIPVTYVASTRDEIIPCHDWRDASVLNTGLSVYAFDDVHGAPHHLRQTRLLTLTALCQHAGRRGLSSLLGLLTRRLMRIRPLYNGPVATGGTP
ncbi:alpha/beta hydrolase [Nocardiopsis quinghaiensis]|uniref:alpha/beta hydrolase n=1 Tax=Nocardiopsis quinghaiensis TaxID=464995 RepID=UPI001239B2DF|nr:alpha/beta hydrolase [Nocardiopsis quinghaiensis]